MCWVCFLVLFLLVSEEIHADQSQKYFYKVVSGSVLSKSDIISSHKVDTELECSYECLKKQACILFSYKAATRQQKNCLLSNKTRDQIIIEDGDWTFYQDLRTVKSESRVEIDNDKNSKRLEAGTNCADLYDSGVRDDGVYTIDPDGQGSFQVRCDMTSGGWTVVQRRLNGSVDFYLGWSHYKTGFGILNGEFWLGLDNIHRLTQSGLKVLRVDLMDFNNAQAYAEYTTFEISNETSRYRLNVAGFSGTAGDSLAYHNGQQFSTKDDDITSNCAVSRKGAWWYKSCAWSNLNGQYLGPNQDQWHGIQWRYWKDTNECMKKADMKLRPRSS